MAVTRKIEIFSAGCSLCDETTQLVNSIACSSCDVQVLDMRQTEVVVKAGEYGIKTVPAVVIDGKLLACCTSGGVNTETLRAAGVGVSLT